MEFHWYDIPLEYHSNFGDIPLELRWFSTIILVAFHCEFMFMKHYAPNSCEPSIEALNLRGEGGGVMVDVNREVKFL